MTQPTVACIMLANGRPEMVARAVKSFRAQTYENKWLMIYDSSVSPSMNVQDWPEIQHWTPRGAHCASIGALRNSANDSAAPCSVFCHWDSDDWSHPNRIAEQVALLQSSGAECVGYNEMLFWNTCQFCDCGRGNILPYCPDCGLKYSPSREVPTGEAWVYAMAFEPQRYAMGASMCYWRETWERHPFPDRSAGCDDLFWFNAKLNICSVSAFQNEYGILKEPAMICGMHGSNTCASAAPGAKEWTRVPVCDGYAREAMRL